MTFPVIHNYTRILIDYFLVIIGPDIHLYVRHKLQN